MAEEREDASWGVLGGADAGASTRTRTTHDNKGRRQREGTAVTVAIVGGGFAGLATALALRHRGIADVRVFERAPRLRYTSQGTLALSANGQAALAELHPEALQRALAVGAPVRAVESVRFGPTGDMESSVRMEAGQPNFPAEGSVSVAWHALQQALASFLLPRGDDVVSTGKGLLSFEEDDGADCVRLRFDDGSVVRCEVAIACDGSFSAVRRQLFPDDRPLFFGHLNWNALVPTDRLGGNAPHPPNAITTTSSSGDPAWSAFANDTGQETTFWQVRVTDPERARAMSGSGGRGGLGLKGVKANLLELVRCSEKMTRVIQATPESDIFERCIIGRQTLPTWLSPGGRVVLIGDAAHGMHPNIGQGANSAFEDVAALVGLMTDGGVSLKEALAAYEKQHKPRIDILHRYANLMGARSLASQTARALTPEMMRTMSPWIKGRKSADEVPPNIMKVLEEADILAMPLVSQIPQ